MSFYVVVGGQIGFKIPRITDNFKSNTDSEELGKSIGDIFSTEPFNCNVATYMSTLDIDAN